MTMTMGPITLRPVRRLFDPRTWFAKNTYMCDKCLREVPTVVGIDYVGFLCHTCHVAHLAAEAAKKGTHP